ncbi:efflux transporter outer membrane subunit [Caulobacter sp. S45]|uniref:efflux transporter outer membrane subunit n=1 Tax=Caulobacter sp. S45 TaxID=1641861 RepID=UPI00131E1082|nr:efflux transporter outer membrane subunit [Caulobacter sp. S45]
MNRRGSKGGSAGVRLAMIGAVASLAALCAACAVGPDYHRPDLPTPAAYQDTGDRTSSPLSQALSTPAPEAQTVAWWTQFGDPVLDDLIARALKDNLDLQTDYARIREAREQEATTAAASLPHVGSSFSVARINDNASTSPLGALLGGGAAGGGAAAGSGPPSHINSFAAAFDATWELDLFGGTRRGVEAARASTEAAVWAKRDGEVSLTAEVATDYLTLRALQARIAIAEQEVARQKDTFLIIHQQAQTGFVTRLNVNQQDAQLQGVIASIPDLEAQARGRIHAIGVLLGENPEALEPQLSVPSDKALPGVPAELPVGLPSELLRRRPDVREAERRLAASTAQVGVQVANLYPKFNILALAPFASNTFQGVFNANSATSIGVGAIQWPIFQGGRVRAGIRSARAEQDEAYFAYKKAVLGALQNVEDALSRYQADQRRIVAQKASVAAAENSLLIARQQYGVGLVTFLNVLNAQQTLLNARDQLTQAQGQIATDLTSLYKALGGGWSANEGKLLTPAGLSVP